jgi:hypothetical protein
MTSRAGAERVARRNMASVLFSSKTLAAKLRKKGDCDGNTVLWALSREYSEVDQDGNGNVPEMKTF